MAAPDTPPGVDRDSWQITFLDILLILVVVLLPLVNPPKAAEQLRPPGSLVVETIWPPECHTDVDLWVQGPVGRAVGYSNQSDMLFNLLRDDLGHQGDLSDLNYENAYTRGLPDGEYIVNLHLYTHRGGCELAVPVDVQVTARGESPNDATIIYQGRTDIARIGDEITVIRFALRNGKLVPGSKHTVPVSLRHSQS